MKLFFVLWALFANVYKCDVMTVNGCCACQSSTVSVERFLSALQLAVKRQLNDCVSCNGARSWWRHCYWTHYASVVNTLTRRRLLDVLHSMIVQCRLFNAH